MDHKSAEGGLPPLDSSYSSAASALFSGGESRSRSLSSVGGREGFEAVQANRAGVRGRESGAGRKENEGSSSRRRSRIPHLVHGKKTEVRSRRGRSVTLSLLLLSLLSLVLRRLLVKCGYLFSKPRNAGSVETFTEGHVHRRLASGGGEDEVTPPSSSPLPASLAACTEEHQAELLNISPARPEGTPEAEELSKGQKALTTEGVEVPGGGRKRKTPRGPDGNAQTGVPPAKQTRGDRVLEVLAAHPHIAAVLMEPLTPPDTSSRKTSDGEARQDAELSTASRMMSQALVVEEFPDSGEEEEPGGPLRRFPERRKPLANDIRGLSSDGYVSIEDAAKQTRRDSLELLAAQALTLLMDSPSPPHTSSRTTSEDEAGEEGPFSTPPRATSQAPVAEGFSESKQEPEGLLVRLLTKGRKFSADNVPGPLRDGHARIEGDDDYQSEAEMWSDPASVQLFRVRARRYIDSLILDTAERQEQWIKSGIPVGQVQNTLRQAFGRARWKGNATASLCVYKILILFQFYLVRGVVVSKATSRSMDPELVRRLRAAQTSIETS